MGKAANVALRHKIAVIAFGVVLLLLLTGPPPGDSVGCDSAVVADGDAELRAKRSVRGPHGALTGPISVCLNLRLGSALRVHVHSHIVHLGGVDDPRTRRSDVGEDGSQSLLQLASRIRDGDDAGSEGFAALH